MWLVSRQWAGLLDGYRMAQALEAQVEREWGVRVRKAEREARAWVEAEHPKRMREYASALAAWEVMEEERRAEEAAREKAWRGRRRNGAALLASVIPTPCCCCMLLPLVSSLDGLFVGELEEAWLWGSRALWGLVMLGGLGLAGALVALGARELSAPGAPRGRAVSLAARSAGKPPMPTLDGALLALPRPPSLGVVAQWKASVTWSRREERTGAGEARYETPEGRRAEWDLASELEWLLGSEFIGIPGLLVDRRLDADLIVIGPNGVWLLESKYWSGLIRVRAGVWTRLRTSGGNSGWSASVDEIPAFDKQWKRQRDAIEAVLRSEGIAGRVGDRRVQGGLVFTHSRVELDLDESCDVRSGDMRDWRRCIEEAPAIPEMDEDARIEIAGALISHGISLGEGGERRATDAATDVYNQTVATIEQYLEIVGTELARNA